MRVLLAWASLLLVPALGCDDFKTPEDNGVDQAPLTPILAKADFVHAEWYVQGTLVDVPLGATRGFTGQTTQLERIRWQITDEFLIGYRSYETRPGTEGNPVTDDYREEPVVMYPILEHLNPPNPRCAERNPPASCNAGDDWLEKTAMRVDWTDQLNVLTHYGASLADGVGFTVPPTDPSRDRFTFDYFDAEARALPSSGADDHPDGALYYFDFTRQVTLKPDASSPYDCRSPVGSEQAYADAYEITIRTSFRRVPDVSDYEPAIHDKVDFHKFGYFTNTRTVIDPYYGVTTSGRVPLINRHGIWRDTWEEVDGELVARPFADRSLRPIVYHANGELPAALFAAGQEVVAGWDAAMRRAVSAVTGDAPESLPPMVVLCHNPVLPADPAVCGQRGTEARIGDLRFNHFAYFARPQTCSPFGFGPSSADPITGELISSQPSIYGQVLDQAAQQALDLVRFTNGDLDFEDLTDAEYIRDQIRARANPAVDPRAVAIDPAQVQPVGDFESMVGPERLAHIDAAGVAAGRSQRAEALADSGWMAALTAAARGPAGDVERPSLQADLKARAIGEGETPTCILEPDHLDEALVSIASRYFGRTDYDAVREELRQAIFMSVMEHEVGHTLGLRHNFAASADYLNYQDTYWDLKTEGVVGIDPWALQLAIVPFLRPIWFYDDIFWLTQPTPAQVLGGMGEHAYSSIMDYSSRFNTNLQGLGRYDRAAILYGYTAAGATRGYVEVFDDAGDATPLLAHFEEARMPHQDKAVESFHYLTLAQWLASDGAQWQLGQGPNVDPQDVGLFLARLRGRSVAPFDQVLAERAASLATHGQPGVGRRVEVPYLFLPDEFVWTRQGARPWDAGATPLEQAQDIIGRYRDGYVFDYFQRDRLYYNEFDAAIRVWQRYLLNFRDGADRWIESFSKPRYDWLLAVDQEWAGVASMNALAEVVTTPQYGSYQVNNDGAINQVAFEAIPGAFQIPPGPGRRWESRVGVQEGSIYPFQTLEMGHFWVTYAALDAMLAARRFTLGPEGGYAVLRSAFDVFPDVTTRLLNGLIAQDASVFGHRVVPGPDGPEVRRSLLLAPQVGPGLYLDVETFQQGFLMQSALDREPTYYINSTFGYLQRTLAAAYGMALMGDTVGAGVGLRFQEQARVFRLGSGEDDEPAPGYETLVFCDPTSATGVCYGAHARVGATDPGLGARLILRAQGHLASIHSEDPALPAVLGEDVEDLELMRALYAQFGVANSGLPTFE